MAFNTFVLALFLAVAFYSILHILHLYNLFFVFEDDNVGVLCFFHCVHFLRSFALESPLVFLYFSSLFLRKFLGDASYGVKPYFTCAHYCDTVPSTHCDALRI